MYTSDKHQHKKAIFFLVATLKELSACVSLRACMLIIVALVMVTVKAFADGTFSVGTIQNAMDKCYSNHCLELQYKGFCLWSVKHRPYVETSPYVSHFLPDLVVSVFSQPDSDPYNVGRGIDKTLLAAVNPAIQQLLNTNSDLSGGQNHAATFNELNEKTKDVSILPNPLVGEFGVIPLLIDSVAKPSDMIYYDSIPDFLMWRLGLAELNISGLLSNGAGIIGTLEINEWGSMYAQEGIIDGANNYVDSAVIAMRAAGLIDDGYDGDYHAGKGRITENHLSMSCGDDCKVLKFSTTTDKKSRTVKWQRIYPDVTGTAISFGAQDLTAMKGGVGDAPTNINDGDYAWLMWRKYEGCVPHRGHYRATVKF